MATVKKYQKGGTAKKDDFAEVMGKSLNSITPGAPGYKPETAADRALAAKQAADMKKRVAAGKPMKNGGKMAKTAKQKKFAALAPPKNKITFADKLAGIKKSSKSKKK